MSQEERMMPQYMNRFRCIGTECEETCCKGWTVPVDEVHYKRIKKAMEVTADGRTLFQSSFKKLRNEKRRDTNFAVMRMKSSDGSCPQMSEDKLCMLQKKHGERILPDTCQVYPRRLMRTGNRREMWATLSCPETARQCLLHDDGMELTAGDEERIPVHLPALLTLPAEPTRPYERYLDDIRGAVFRLLSLRQYPIGSRLFFVSYFAKLTGEFFRQDSKSVDESKLADALTRVERPGVLDAWHQEISSMPAFEDLSSKTVEVLLSMRLDSEHSGTAGSLGSLAIKVILGFQGEGVTFDEAAQQAQVDYPAVWASYAVRRETWQSTCQDRVDLYFENYAKNYWMGEWYTQTPDLISHQQRLLARIAVLRFLLFGHPSLVPVMKTANVADKKAILDRTAVEVFYKFVRAIEHHPTYLVRVYDALVKEGMMTFGHSALLALF